MSAIYFNLDLSEIVSSGNELSTLRALIDMNASPINLTTINPYLTK